MRVTTRANLAIRVLMVCAVHPGRLVTTAEVAERCNGAVNHVARVVQRLQTGGALATRRGRTGGLRLARPAERISIGAVVRMFEDTIPVAECFEPETNTCPLVGACRLRGYLTRAVEAYYHELDMATLDDLVRGNCGLEELLALEPATPGACAGHARPA